MAELLPTWQAGDLVERIERYLTTTFALSDTSARESVRRFLRDPESGMFKGPYVRLRLPFEAAQHGWEDSLDFYGADFPPYGHQARAFERLTSKGGDGQLFRRPEPTLVTTGTGSGKTESFLYPILDHVLRAQRSGITGIKALILYPMNALANDQASRLAQLIMEHPELQGVRAALYTGQTSSTRSRVTADGLINDRHEIRKNPPDILLTNYKMLDMLLLRHEDAGLWKDSATSLQYLVLDEFHTYDGAQGTDVAMLLRRLGHTLKSHWPQDLENHIHGPTEQDRARPLGHITPVATSATLGGAGGADTMLEFAETIFGEELTPEALITETRKEFTTWQEDSTPPATEPREVDELPQVIAETNEAVRKDSSHHAVISAALSALFHSPPSAPVPADELLAALRHHPFTQALVEHSQQAASLRDVASGLFPRLPGTASLDDATEFLSHLIALYSHARAVCGRDALTVETHLWVRELSRIDAAVDVVTSFRWSDDGTTDVEAESAMGEDLQKLHLPAIYCRHCGKSGWGAKAAPEDGHIITESDEIRQASLHQDSSFRALMNAVREADDATQQSLSPAETRQTGLRYLHTVHHTLQTDPPGEQDEDFQRGYIVPVKLHVSQEAGDLSRDDTCPVCLTPDAIRFVGSAIATLTSVAVTNLFGSEDLDAQEKKALIFTDSVQDAAHRAGFIQARAHTFTLRSALRRAFGEGKASGEGRGQEMTLSQLVDRTMMTPPGLEETARRYRLLPPDLADRPGFREFWEPRATPRQRQQAETRVKRRLLFDASLELGLQARLGRTLELTGTVVAEVDAGSRASLLTAAQRAWDAKLHVLPDIGLPTEQRYLNWVRGVLVRIRLQGGIDHPWLESYIRHDGARYHVWGGRRRHEGMPAFPDNRPAPAFPVIGPSNTERGLDPVTSAGSWYTTWTHRTLGVSREDASRLARELFEELARTGVLQIHTTEPGARAYSLHPDRIVLATPTDEDLAAGRLSLRCEVCESQSFGTADVVDQLADAPCLQSTCTGTIRPAAIPGDDFYRSMYENPSARRIVAREHTSLLEDKLRLEYEDAFRSSEDHPDAPNVLVATPTLEMGIDIGDLSCVVLASMPRTVASYVQRVGRAGRLTGNSLVLAFARGRGEHLPKLYDPLSVINGEVRAPSTYLQADEILTRQYAAFLADHLARDPQAPHPATVKQALGSTEPDSYLGQLQALSETRGAELVEEFIAQFGEHLDENSCQRLRRWSAEDLTGVLQEAHRRWTQDQEDLQRRIADVERAVAELDRDHDRASKDYPDPEHPKVQEALRNLRSAKSQLKRLYHEAGEERRDYWLSALEHHGVFPNYTLIGDAVTLEVGISWRDEETQQFVAASETFSRASGVALQELAPGTRFYAQGMEIAIDAVELGPDAREIQDWQICPACGWRKAVERISEDPVKHRGTVTTCPRCRDAGIADIGQIRSVVKLSKVSAEVRRDEAVISDSRDERQRTMFAVLGTADIDVSGSQSWFVKNTGLGVRHLRSVDLTWYNLGRQGRGGTQLRIAGHEIAAPLFPLCTYCGQQDTHARENHAQDHRFWCRHRTSQQEHTRQVILARTLTTQGVCLTLPVAATAADEFAVPTLKAALLMGLHQHLGGTPGALGVMSVPDPSAGEGQDALLLHDTVPGGTGYLSIFLDPEKVHGALVAAWKTVRACPCRDEGRRSCHRCLLPFADYGHEDSVSTVAAERLLTLMLGLGGKEAGGAEPQGTEEPSVASWQIQEEIEADTSGESHLEIAFRTALKQRLEAINARVEPRPGPTGEVLDIVMPDNRRRWKLEPQVDVAGSRPDFLLSADDPNLPTVAVFTDGRAYHADPAHNRVGDDAVKRHRIRDVGTRRHIPWAVTAEDVERFHRGADSTPDDGGAGDWISDRALGMFMQHHSLDASITRALHAGSMELLWCWMLHPELEAWEKVADVAPALAMTSLTKDVPPEVTGAESLGRGAQEALSTHLRRGPGDEPAAAWWRRHDEHLQLVTAGDPTSRKPGALRTVLLLQDDDDALHSPAYAQSWRRWLFWSNLIAFRETTDHAVVATSSHISSILDERLPAQSRRAVAEETAVEPTQSSVEEPTLPSEWLSILTEAYEDERSYLQELAQIEGLSAPDFGHEIDGIPTQLAWRRQRVVVTYEVDEAHELQKAGWTALPTDDVPGVLKALSIGQGRED
ncbi:DEAD/DEAH box helicase [Nesterenkonia suensis]